MKRLVLLFIIVFCMFFTTSCIEQDRVDYTRQIDVVESPRMFFPTGTGITWDNETLTLTLDNATIDCSDICLYEYTTTLNLPDKSTINLIGDSVIKSAQNDEYADEVWNNDAVKCTGDLLITGNGSLTIELYCKHGNESSAIFTDSNLQVDENVTLNIFHKDYFVDYTCSLIVNGELINSGEINVNSFGGKYYTEALYAYVLLHNTKTGSINLRAMQEGANYIYGINGSKVLNEGTIMVECGSEGAFNLGIYTYHSLVNYGGISVDTNYGYWSRGIYLSGVPVNGDEQPPYEDGFIENYGAIITESKGAEFSSSGMYAYGYIHISGQKAICMAEGGDSKNSLGICSRDYILIDEGCYVHARSGEGEMSSAILAQNSFTIKNSRLICEGGFDTTKGENIDLIIWVDDITDAYVVVDSNVKFNGVKHSMTTYESNEGANDGMWIR